MLPIITKDLKGEMADLDAFLARLQQVWAKVEPILRKLGLISADTAKKTEETAAKTEETAAKTEAAVIHGPGQRGRKDAEGRPIPGERFPLVTTPHGTGPGGMETDEEYFRRTGYHYGARYGEAGQTLQRPPSRAEEIPIGGTDPSRRVATLTQEAMPEAAEGTKKATNDMTTDLGVLNEAIDQTTKAVGTIATAWNTAETAFDAFETKAHNDLVALTDQLDAFAQKAASAMMQSAQTTDLPTQQGYASGGYVRPRRHQRQHSGAAQRRRVCRQRRCRARVGRGVPRGIKQLRLGRPRHRPAHPFRRRGLVASGVDGGQTVASFHFESGKSYSLSGPADVVGAMVGEAHAQQMRSAGVKPSWFAGRAGGR